MRRSGRPDIEDRTIGGFCKRHDISKPTFYRLPQKERDALVGVYGKRTLRITPEAEAEFDRTHAKPHSAGQELLDKMKAKRTAQAKKAAGAAVASERHVSKRRRRS